MVSKHACMRTDKSIFSQDRNTKKANLAGRDKVGGTEGRECITIWSAGRELES